jgi:mannose-1-phosphate guanylyltransferase
MRNTAAAIGLAALHVARRDPDGVMVVLPADHFIDPPERFLSCFRAAVRRASEKPVLLTVGIRPTGPATGYGYIEAGEEVGMVDGHPILAVRSFKEKPSAATAAAFLAKGNYFWNAGTFVWHVRTLLDAFRAHLPGHAEVLARIEASIAKGEPPRPEDYARFENIPIDMGVMERASNVETTPADFSGTTSARGRGGPAQHRRTDGAIRAPTRDRHLHDRLRQHATSSRRSGSTT